MELKDRMLEYRAKNSISQKELANRVGVTLQTINAVEAGTQTPSALTRAKIELIIGKEKE